MAAPGTKQLDLDQTTKACKVLLKTIKEERERRETENGNKKNLLASNDDESGDESGDEPVHEENDTPVWMILTTKKHISDTKRLKPHKIPIPHPLNSDSSASICLITSDPQRLYKDAIADPAFPKELSSRITRVIGLQKLKGKYKSYEARRQLAAEHDIFLADSRVVTWLPGVLGKVFHKGTSKRPIPVNIAGASDENSEGRRIKKVPGARKKSVPNQEGRGVAAPAAVAREMLKALDSAVVYLSPSASTSVKVGRAAMTPDMLAKNIEKVVDDMASKCVPQGWKNVRAIHIKGPETMAFPIWLASELWTDEADVLEEKKVMGKRTKGNKRSALALTDGEAAATDKEAAVQRPKRSADETSKPSAARHVKKKRRADAESEQPDALAQSLERKQKLKQQKAAAMLEVA